MKYLGFSAVLSLLIGCNAFLLDSPLKGKKPYDSYCEKVATNDYPRNCLELTCRGYNHDGVYDVYSSGNSYFKISVYCDQTTNGGGWTVFQRRMDGSVDFFRNWQNYKLGFGEVRGEHWLGMENMRAILSTNTLNKLRVDLEDFDNERRYAEYSKFSLSNEAAGYQLISSGYTGTAGDSLLQYGDRATFSTKDRDQDAYAYNCASLFKGSWWYKDCHDANLNALYLSGNHTSRATGINWYSWRGHYYSLKTTEMKIRPNFD